MTVFGPDLSNYQADIDLGAVASAGCDFVIGKITEGASYRNPAWPKHRDAARAHGLLIAGYHFLSNDPPAQQAANCKAWIGDTGIPVALDWENGGGNWSNFLGVLAAFRDAGLHVILAYAPRWYWQAQGSPDISAAGIPLWSSRYPTTAPGAISRLYAAVTDTHWAGYGGADVALLQFADSAQIGGHIVDCSAFRGTRDQLAALFNAAPAPGPAATSTTRRNRTGEDSEMFIETPAPADGAAKSDWPSKRISFGFDPINGWGGRCVIKAHWGFPGGWITEALWWVRSGSGVGNPNAPHTPVGINLAGVQERFVGMGWEIAPPERADELELVIAAPGGLHLFTTYEK